VAGIHLEGWTILPDFMEEACDRALVAGDVVMLVLTRSIDEGIVIGDNIRVTVVRVNGSVVRIGVEAPQHASILRGEHLITPREEAPTGQDERRPS
jgi:carbon storage regulator CsrA